MKWVVATLALVVVGCGSSDSATSGSGGASGSDAGVDAAGGSAGAAGSVGAPDGTACLDSEPCQSGHCVDGVCCDSACDAPCESCAVAGKQGTCTPFAGGTDPESDCVGASGAESLCTGTCDGQSGCLFPGTEITCGTSQCTAGTQQSKLCDGAGTCSTVPTDCGLYACNANTCNTSCSGPTDCNNLAFCSAGACVKKLANGAACNSAPECESGFCESGHCCGGSCAAPATCDSGTCLCGGKTCAAGTSCVVWHLDKDGDGFGSTDATTDQVACSDSSPGASFVLDGTDCYDENLYVFPGQTQYFSAHRGDNSFDYDCDGAESKQYATVLPGTQCVDCGFKNPFTAACDACPSFFGTQLFNMGYSCTGAPACSGVLIKEAFKTSVACGLTGTLYSCSSTACSTSETTDPRVQGCR